MFLSDLVAIGVTGRGHTLVLGMQSGDKESASSWREFFKGLKLRGLSSRTVALDIMDGLSGLETVFREEFSQARVQRCIVHVDRNVIAKVPKKMNLHALTDVVSFGSSFTCPV